MVEIKPCQCGADVDNLKTWADLASKQIRYLRDVKTRLGLTGLTELFMDTAEKKAFTHSKESFLETTSGIRKFQKRVQESCEIDMSKAQKNILKAEEDVKRNKFSLADVELSEAELKLVVGLLECSRD